MAKETLRWQVDALCPDAGALTAAGELLRWGGLVAFPTETVYGLGAHAGDVAAVAALFAVKGRPLQKGLILHIAAREELWPYVREVSPLAARLIEAFWPGPLTLVFKSSGRLPAAVTGGLPTLAVRVPAHPVALGLIRAAGVPVVAPSANLSGRPSPVTAAAVLADLDGRIDAVIDSGPAPLGVASTVLDVTGEVPRVLRSGAVGAAEIAAVTGTVPEGVAEKEESFRFGIPLILVEGAEIAVKAEIERLYARFTMEGKKVGVIAREENVARYPGTVIPCGRVGDANSVAAGLYVAVGRLATAVDLILFEGVSEEIGFFERLRRLAAQVTRMEARL
ncbi:L-threonylcarbamoyladenylate synthase [Thermodesulfitimonas sp.]